MPGQTSQPTVLVKKSDGSVMRVPLSEINKMKSGSTPVKPAVVPPSPPVTPRIEDQKSSAVSPPQKTTVRNDSPKPEVISAPVKGQIVRSDKMPSSSSLPAQSSTGISKVDEVITHLSFQVPPEYINRLRSLIQLRIKGVRDDGQTKAVAMRPLKDGGLGLTDIQSKELLNNFVKDDPPPVTKREMPKTLKEIANSLPPSSAPRPSIPMEKKVVPLMSATTPKQSTPPPAISKMVTEKPMPRIPLQPVMPKYTPTPVRKSTVQDVVVKPAQMSPVDEIKYFTLTDFRRLSSDPTEAADRLKQKFLNLKEESYLLFLEAKEKWRLSPLFISYMEVVDGALSNKTKLVSAILDKEGIQLSEISALVNMEKELS